MPIIEVHEKSSFDAAFRRFKRLCEKSGILGKAKQRYYEKPTTKRKRKKAAAVKRHLKRLHKEREVLERDRGRY